MILCYGGGLGRLTWLTLILADLISCPSQPVTAKVRGRYCCGGYGRPGGKIGRDLWPERFVGTVHSVCHVIALVGRFCLIPYKCTCRGPPKRAILGRFSAEHLAGSAHVSRR